MWRYEIVHLFGPAGSAGSPLAVLPDAGGMPAGVMLAVAARLGTPQTAFVTGVSAAGYRVRVLGPAAECSSGGHSAIGIAAVLARLGLIRPGRVVQESGSGEVTVHVRDGAAALKGTAPAACLDTDAAVLAAVAGLAAPDVLDVPGRAAGFGHRFCYLPVRPGAVGRVRADQVELARHGLADLVVFSWDPGRRLAHARLLGAGHGPAGHPACGPAALGLGLWLADAGWLPARDGAVAFGVRQDDGPGGPAELHCGLVLTDGQVIDAAVSGTVASAGGGRLTLRREPARCQGARRPPACPAGHGPARPYPTASGSCR